MLVVGILDVAYNDAGCCNQNEILQAGVQVYGVDDFSRVTNTVIEFNLLGR